jgi:predicted ribosomally synthesized peptide with SipW-like signal peptide
MKKILLSMLAIAAVSIAAFESTKALFSDQETSVGNTFTAGTLDLTVDGKNDPEVKNFTLSDMKPGDRFGRKYFTLKNNGSIPGVPKVCLTNLVNTESAGASEYENDGEPGELGDNIDLLVDAHGSWLMTSGNKLNTFSERCWTPVDPRDIEFAAQGKEVLDPEETMNFGVRLDIPTTVGNSIQGDGVSFDLEFSLEQTSI